MLISALAPHNDGGTASDTFHSIECAGITEAQQLFKQAAHRLLHVNKWHALTGMGTAVFSLTDEYGQTVDRSARLGDHFKIDIPGPGSIAGKGDDWVQVEAIETRHKADEEIVAMRVRPAQNPGSNDKNIAHFFSQQASSTFFVSRKNNVVAAGVQGRNEKPNVTTRHIADKVRNAVVGLGAMAGLNKPQWTALVKGLLQ